MQPAIVFDGDDTLWDTQILYEKAKQRLYELLGRLGHDEPAVAAKLAEIDTDNIRSLGLARSRFPRSLRETYEFFAQQTGRTADRELSRVVETFGEGVFEQTPFVRPDATDVLNDLTSRYRLILFTAGDEQVQRDRIDGSGLGPFFHRAHVPPQKNLDTWRALLQSEDLLPAITWSIGNSIRSDINPALTLGLRCVLVSGGSWEFERVPLAPGAVWRAATLREAATVVLEQDGLTSAGRGDTNRAGREPRL